MTACRLYYTTGRQGSLKKVCALCGFLSFVGSSGSARSLALVAASLVAGGEGRCHTTSTLLDQVAARDSPSGSEMVLWDPL